MSGRKTVKGPGLLRVSTRPAALTAATRVLWIGELAAFSTMVLGGVHGGAAYIWILLGTGADGGDGQSGYGQGCEECLLHLSLSFVIHNF